jgi:hypothetical protein
MQLDSLARHVRTVVLSVTLGFVGGLVLAGILLTPLFVLLVIWKAKVG